MEGTTFDTKKITGVNIDYILFNRYIIKGDLQVYINEKLNSTCTLLSIEIL